MKSELLTLRIAMAHIHVANSKDDACDLCGLDLRNPVHATVNISRQKAMGSKICHILLDRR